MEGATNEFGGDVEFSGGKSFGFKEIVILHLRKILSLTAVEYRGGYLSTYKSKGGEEREIYVQDTRETYGNGVLSLAMLLEPKFNKETGEAYKKFNEDLAQLKKDFIEKSSVEEKVILGEGYYSNAKDKILLETFKQNKLQLVHKLFSALSHQLAKMNYMDITGFTY